MEDLEKKIKDSKNCIEKANANNSKQIYNMAKNTHPNETMPKKQISLRIITKYAIAVVVFMLVFTGGFFLSKALIKPEERIVEIEVEKEKEKIIQTYVYRNGVSSRDDVTVNYQEVARTDAPLSFGSFNNKEELISYLNDTKTKTSTALTGDELSFESNQSGAIPGAEYDFSESSSTYQTNTQVENVDEADIVKVKGNHIFYLTNSSKCYMFTEIDGELLTTNVLNFGEEIEELKSIDRNGYKNAYQLVSITRTEAKDLYVTDKYLIIRINKYEYKATRERYTEDNKDKYIYQGSYDYSNTCIFAIYDVNTLELVTSIETAGTNVSTRLIGNTLYVINNYNDYLRNKNLFYYYPYIYINDGLIFPKIDNIYCCDDKLAKTYVSIYKIDLEDEITIEDLHILTPVANKIYSSQKNIYLIRTYDYEIVKEDEYELSYPKTRLVVVNIEEGLTLSGAFDVKGNINNKYWIDEKDNAIRVVTTGYEAKGYYFDQKYVYASESIAFNYLTIFKKTDDGFEQSAIITEGIGKPHETIRSARFNDDLVTIVTYQNTDPLYYIDISDPENPVITSSLEITGYSVYQHPYKDNYVIGFGYLENGNRSGFKISLFDISDKTNIKQVGNSYIIENYVQVKDNNNYYELRYDTPEFYSDPKALFVNNELGLFGFCLKGLNTYRVQRTVDGDIRYITDLDASKYIYRYLVISIDEESDNPIKVEKIAENIMPYRTKKAESSYTYYNAVGPFYQRLVFIGNNYYLLSSSKVDCYQNEDNKLIASKTIALGNE